MAEYVGIEWTEVGENYLKAKMPVDHRTIQPYGLMHGGASCTLAETVGSDAVAPGVIHVEAHVPGQPALDGEEQRVVRLRSAVVDAIHRSVEPSAR